MKIIQSFVILIFYKLHFSKNIMENYNLKDSGFRLVWRSVMHIVFKTIFPITANAVGNSNMKIRLKSVFKILKKKQFSNADKIDEYLSKFLH